MAGLGFVGLRRGSFSEMEDATRTGTRWKFYLCAVTYISLGLGATLLGIDAIANLGIIE